MRPIPLWLLILIAIVIVAAIPFFCGNFQG